VTAASIPGDPTYRAAQRRDLLRFMAASRHPLGFGWLRDDRTLEPGRPVELWISCRMTHVACLGVLAAEPPAPDGPALSELRDLAEHGVRSLTGPFADAEHGGWFSAVGPDGVVDAAKAAYAHAFVVLAASSAVVAEVPGAETLLDEALRIQLEHFWDDSEGLVVEKWDRAWGEPEPYRGVNAVMHTVEAYLAAGDATGDPVWRERAGRMAARVAGWAAGNDWRIPEHFDPSWSPLPDFNRDHPADPFRPYGATIGHGLEWARLLIQVDAGHAESAAALFARAVTDGWSVDGADGFVYTTDWAGSPVVRERMHWVIAEAVNAASTLERVTGEQRYVEDAARWWAYAERHLVDHERGSWHHELDPHNRPSAVVWSGKPDVYHAYQAALLPDVPLVPSFATALRNRAQGQP